MIELCAVCFILGVWAHHWYIKDRKRRGLSDPTEPEKKNA